jgi:hypothetical protein
MAKKLEKKKIGRPPKLVSCQFCDREMGTAEFLRHVCNCPKRPETGNGVNRLAK